MHPAVFKIQEAIEKMSPMQVAEMMRMLKKSYPAAFRQTENMEMFSVNAKEDEKTAKYYYISANTLEELEYTEEEFPTRRWVMCQFEDYPYHRHTSSGCVDIMELIPEKRYKNTRYMCDSKTYFSSICLPQSAIITVDGKMYIKNFEEYLGTAVWQKYIQEQNEKSGEPWQ